VVGDVSDDLDFSTPAGRGKIIIKDIHSENLHTLLSFKTVAQCLFKPCVDFDGDDLFGFFRQFFRQQAETGTDFNNRLIAARIRDLDNLADDIHILQKGLPQPFLGTNLIMVQHLPDGDQGIPRFLNALANRYAIQYARMEKNGAIRIPPVKRGIIICEPSVVTVLKV